MKFQGKTAVITGASTGIGQAIAKVLGQNGGNVALIGRDKAGLDQTKQMVVSSGGQATIFLADLSDRQSAQKLGKELNQSLRAIDFIVNVAGVWHNDREVFYGPNLAETPEVQVCEVLEVGIMAPVLLTRTLLPKLIQRGQGKILNISGTFSSGGTGWLHYYVSKKALEAFTVGLADDLRKDEIQVNCISPSDVATPALKRFFPDDAGTALQPDDVASLAMFLLSPDADHITGQIIVIKNKQAHPPKN